MVAWTLSEHFLARILEQQQMQYIAQLARWGINEADRPEYVPIPRPWHKPEPVAPVTRADFRRALLGR